MHSSIKKQKGVALGYVFGLIALLAIIGAMVVGDAGVKQSAISQKRLTDAIVGQANLIRNALFLCQISYPNGGPSGGTDNAFPATTTDIANSVCPGSPSSEKVFGGVSDVFYPRSIEGFLDWSLTNDASGVSITLQLDVSAGTNQVVAMEQAAKELGNWNTVLTASALTFYVKN